MGTSTALQSLEKAIQWKTSKLILHGQQLEAHIDGQKRVAGAAPGEDVQTQLLRSTQNGKGEVLNALDGSSDTRNPESDIISYEAPVASEQSAIPESFPRPKLVAVDINLKAAAAWQTGFVMMDEDGNVYTLGDRRYAACLGRPVTADQPAEGPHMVEDLPDHTDKIRKVVAGGYTVGALTEEGHLYAWGMQTPGHASSEKQAITGLSAMPNYQSIPKEGEDEDVADVSFGDCHALALTREGNVYVIGGNKNGQLGLGWDRKHRAESWEKVDLDLGEYRVKEVVAGPQTSFLIARLP